jgi:hypothetical protein
MVIFEDIGVGFDLLVIVDAVDGFMSVESDVLACI